MTLSLFLGSALFLGGGSAWAETQEMVYDLVLGEESVGRRRVTVRYLPSDGGEVRVLESYTELSVPLGRKSFLFVQRTNDCPPLLFAVRGICYLASCMGKVQEVIQSN